MDEYVVKAGKRLRMGYTTGSCAAAASKAACRMLLLGGTCETISLLTPAGKTLELAVEDITRGEGFVRCAIRKDSGDDPDVTNGALIYSEVSLTEGEDILIDGGFGVGRVTKPGLDQPPGAAAINSVPRRMIRENLEELRHLADYRGGLKAVISIPEGENLARKTFNPRLGITGGISVLGTTGIVEPMSEQALVDTIRVELRQRRATGADYVLLTPGNYGSDFIKASIPVRAERAVMTSNFIGDSLDMCRELGFKGALLIGHVGKLVKIAGGMLNTHSKYGDCRMHIMTAYAAQAGIRRERIAEMLECAACDDALRILREEGLEEPALRALTERISFILDYRVGGEMQTGAIMFSKEYGLLSKTDNADQLLEYIREEL